MLGSLFHKLKKSISALFFIVLMLFFSAAIGTSALASDASGTDISSETVEPTRDITADSYYSEITKPQDVDYTDADLFYTIYNFDSKYYFSVPIEYQNKIAALGSDNIIVQFNPYVYLSVKGTDYYSSLESEEIISARENYTIGNSAMDSTFNDIDFVTAYMEDKASSYSSLMTLRSVAKEEIGGGQFWVFSYTTTRDIDAYYDKESEAPIGEIKFLLNITSGNMYFIMLNCSSGAIADYPDAVLSLYSFNIGYRTSPAVYIVWAVAALIILFIIFGAYELMQKVTLVTYDASGKILKVQASKRVLKKIGVKSMLGQTQMISASQIRRLSETPLSSFQLTTPQQAELMEKEKFALRPTEPEAHVDLVPASIAESPFSSSLQRIKAFLSSAGRRISVFFSSVFAGMKQKAALLKAKVVDLAQSAENKRNKEEVQSLASAPLAVSSEKTQAPQPYAFEPVNAVEQKADELIQRIDREKRYAELISRENASDELSRYTQSRIDQLWQQGLSDQLDINMGRSMGYLDTLPPGDTDEIVRRWVIETAPKEKLYAGVLHKIPDKDNEITKVLKITKALKEPASVIASYNKAAELSSLTPVAKMKDTSLAKYAPMNEILENFEPFEDDLYRRFDNIEFKLRELPVEHYFADWEYDHPVFKPDEKESDSTTKGYADSYNLSDAIQKEDKTEYKPLGSDEHTQGERTEPEAVQAVYFLTPDKRKEQTTRSRKEGKRRQREAKREARLASYAAKAEAELEAMNPEADDTVSDVLKASESSAAYDKAFDKPQIEPEESTKEISQVTNEATDKAADADEGCEVKDEADMGKDAENTAAEPKETLNEFSADSTTAEQYSDEHKAEAAHSVIEEQEKAVATKDESPEEQQEQEAPEHIAPQAQEEAIVQMLSEEESDAAAAACIQDNDEKPDEAISEPKENTKEIQEPERQAEEEGQASSDEADREDLSSEGLQQAYELQKKEKSQTKAEEAVPDKTDDNALTELIGEADEQRDLEQAAISPNADFKQEPRSQHEVKPESKPEEVKSEENTKAEAKATNQNQSKKKKNASRREKNAQKKKEANAEPKGSKQAKPNKGKDE